MDLLRRLRRARRDPRAGDPLEGARLVRGTRADERALARFHYRGGAPAPGSRVWALRDRGSRQTLAVLVVSAPVLNAWWRPNPAREADPAAAARRLNRDLRVISRVIVDPRCRALGLGTRMVRAYLRRAMSPRTEALAAMGSLCPIFARAGMRRLGRRPERPVDARLRRALARERLAPERLAAPWSISRAKRRRIAPVLRTWARASAATRPLAAARLDVLMPAAAGSLRGPWVFVSERRAPLPRGGWIRTCQERPDDHAEE